MSQTEWHFEGTSWDFIHMVRRACAVYEYVRLRRKGIIDLLTDEEAYKEAVAEFGLTYDAVKAEMRRAIDNADQVDTLLRDAARNPAMNGGDSD